MRISVGRLESWRVASRHSNRRTSVVLARAAAGRAYSPHPDRNGNLKRSPNLSKTSGEWNQNIVGNANQSRTSYLPPDLPQASPQTHSFPTHGQQQRLTRHRQTETVRHAERQTNKHTHRQGYTNPLRSNRPRDVDLASTGCRSSCFVPFRVCGYAPAICKL